MREAGIWNLLSGYIYSLELALGLLDPNATVHYIVSINDTCGWKLVEYYALLFVRFRSVFKNRL